MAVGGRSEGSRMSLTPQEEKFCLEYIGNGKKRRAAAIAAGYPEDEADTIAKGLLKRADIRAEIKLYAQAVVIDPPEYWAARAEFGQ